MKVDTHQDGADVEIEKKHFLLNRSFGLLWTGQTISELGTAITGAGVPIAAIFLLKANPVQVGVLAALSSAPMLFAGLFAGVWVDRLPRRPILILADIGRALLLLSIPLSALLGWLRIELLYIVTALCAVLTVFFNVAHQSYLPAIIKKEQLVEGNSKLGTSMAMAEIVGPSLAGILIQLITAPIAILFDGLSYLVSALCIGLIRSKRQQAKQNEQGEKREKDFWLEVREGLRELIDNPLLRAVVGGAAIEHLFGGMFAPFYLLYVVGELHVSPAGYGVLVTAGGISALVGSLVTSWIIRRIGLGKALIFGQLVFAAFALLIPLAWGPQLVIYIFLLVSQLGDIGIVVFEVAEVSLRQHVVPDHMLGRVNAGARVIVEGATLLAILVAILLSTVLGVRWTLLIAASGKLLAVLWLLFSPVRKLKRLE